MNKYLAMAMITLLVGAFAQEANVTGAEAIEKQIMNIYNLIAYIASAIAIVALAFAGIKFMTSGNDPHARNDAKNIAMAAVVGLIIIWLAPAIVQALR